MNASPRLRVSPFHRTRWRNFFSSTGALTLKAFLAGGYPSLFRNVVGPFPPPQASRESSIMNSVSAHLYLSLPRFGWFFSMSSKFLFIALDELGVLFFRLNVFLPLLLLLQPPSFKNPKCKPARSNPLSMVDPSSFSSSCEPDAFSTSSLVYSGPTG